MTGDQPGPPRAGAPPVECGVGRRRPLRDGRPGPDSRWRQRTPSRPGAPARTPVVTPGVEGPGCTPLPGGLHPSTRRLDPLRPRRLRAVHAPPSVDGPRRSSAPHRVDRTGQDLDHVLDLGDRGGQWGHHHHHVTQGTEQNAPVDRPGAHPPAPPFASGRRGQLDARHQPPLADGADPRLAGDPVGQVPGQRPAAVAVTLARTSHSSRAGGDAGQRRRPARSRRRSARGRRSARPDQARRRRRIRGPRPRWPTRGGSRR